MTIIKIDVKSSEYIDRSTKIENFIEPYFNEFFLTFLFSKLLTPILD